MDLLVLITQILKATSELAICGHLLYQWRSHSPRYLTDLPCMYGVVFGLLGMGEVVDVMIEALILPGITLSHQFRLLFVVAGVSLMLFSLFQIWVPRKHAVKYGVPLIYSLVWTIVTLISPTRELIYLFAVGFLLSLIIPNFGTYYLVYRYRRLPNIDARWIMASTLLLIIGQGFKTWFLAAGILWISEAIDLFAWMCIYIGLTHAAPYAQEQSAVETPIELESSPTMI